MVSEIREMACEVIEEFEELMEEKNITISSDDREGRKEEARIYGSEYYQLEDGIATLLAKRMDKIRKDLKHRLKTIPTFTTVDLDRYFEYLKEGDDGKRDI